MPRAHVVEGVVAEGEVAPLRLHRHPGERSVCDVRWRKDFRPAEGASFLTTSITASQVRSHPSVDGRGDLTMRYKGKGRGKCIATTDDGLNEMALNMQNGGAEMSIKTRMQLQEAVCKVQLLGGSSGSGSLCDVAGHMCVSGWEEHKSCRIRVHWTGGESRSNAMENSCRPRKTRAGTEWCRLFIARAAYIGSTTTMAQSKWQICGRCALTS